MAEFLGMVELGTLYKDGEELPLPTRPWVSDSYPGKLSNRGKGDIPQFTSLKDMSKWVIGDTSSKEENKLKWIKIKDGDKILLICDRVILNSISWDDLNNAGYVLGKEIIIDGKKYACRLLIGGEDTRVGTNLYSGAIPTDNEWDRFIINEANISGLPKPIQEDLDSTFNYDDLDREHNQMWNWWGNYSFCKESFRGAAYSKTARGYLSGNYIYSIASWSTSTSTGWRPVLEALKYKKYLLKQNNHYYSIKLDFYDSTTGQYKPVDKDFEVNGFDNLEDLTKEVNGFRPIDKFKGKIEILKQDEK